jgi:hypothetical protein
MKNIMPCFLNLRKIYQGSLGFVKELLAAQVCTHLNLDLQLSSVKDRWLSSVEACSGAFGCLVGHSDKPYTLLNSTLQ